MSDRFVLLAFHEVNLGALGADRVYAILRHVLRQAYDSPDPERSCDIGDGSSVVPGGCGDHAGYPPCFALAEHGVRGSSNLERAGGLYRLQLEQDGCAVHLAQPTRRPNGSLAGYVRDAPGRLANGVERRIRAVAHLRHRCSHPRCPRIRPSTLSPRVKRNLAWSFTACGLPSFRDHGRSRDVRDDLRLSPGNDGLLAQRHRQLCVLI